MMQQLLQIIYGCVLLIAITTLCQAQNVIRVEFTQNQYTGSEQTGFIRVDLELIGGTFNRPFDVTVTLSEQSPVSAEAGHDFINAPMTASFPTGATMASVGIPVIPDNIVEGPEQFDITLNVPSSLGPRMIAGSRNTAVVVITDSSTMAVEFALGQFTGSELSGFIEVAVRTTGATSGSPITVTVTPSEQSPVSATGSGVDFNSTSFPITINAGAIEGRATISVTCDKVVEELETFDLSLTLTSSSSGVTLGRDTSKGEIIDSTIVVSFGHPSHKVMEDNGTVSIMITLSKPSPEPFQITVNTMDVTALDGKDYTGGSIIVNVPAEVTKFFFSIAIVDDHIIEPDETFTVTISSVTLCNVAIGTLKKTEVTITNDDSALPVIAGGHCVPHPNIISSGNMAVPIGSPAYIVDGYNLNLTCNVIGGVPPVYINWYRSGVLVQSNVNATTSPNITIKEVDINKDDGIIYTCRAHNDRGYVEERTIINVFAPLCSHDVCNTRKNILCIIPYSSCLCKPQMGYCSAVYYSFNIRPVPVTCATCSDPTDLTCLKKWSNCIKKRDESANGRPSRRMRTKDNFKIYQHPC